MNTTVDRANFWDDQVWASIDEGVTSSIGAIRVCQQVFPTEQAANTTSVPADIFHPDTMSITEGIMAPFVELAAEFPLTNGQVNDDPTGSTVITLSKFAGKALALAEDGIILQGKDSILPPGVRIESGGEAIGRGLLGLAHERTITVSPPDLRAPTNSGGEILLAVARGIALLTSQVQAPLFALIEDTNAYAATTGSVINGAPAYSVLNSVLAQGIFGAGSMPPNGIYGTGSMPPNTGLLIALGGDPTTIYVGTNAITEPTYKGARGVYNFRTYERLQTVARDHRAFLKLDFSYLSDGGQEEEKSEIAGRRPGATGRQHPAEESGRGISDAGNAKTGSARAGR